MSVSRVEDRNFFLGGPDEKVLRAMGHRHFSNSFNTFEMDQGHNQNHLTAEESYYIHMARAVAPENGSFVYPMDNTLRSGVHSASQWNLENRGNEYPSSNFSMEAPHLQPSFSGPSYDPFPHSSLAGNLHLTPENNIGHAHSSYHNRHTIHEIEGGLLDPTMGSGRGPFKRKSPGVSVASEGGSTSRFYTPGSSSGSSELLLEKPTPGYQYIPSGPIGLPQYRSGSLSIAGEDSLRNVRSRSRIDLAANPTRTQLSSYSYHYHSTTNPTNYSGAVDLTNMNATTRQLNTIPLSTAAHGMIQTSDTNGLNHETNQFHFMRGSAAGGYHHNSISSGNPISSSHHLHGPPTQAAREGFSNYSQRTLPSYSDSLSYPRLGHEAASSENSLQSLSETYSSRYSRSSSAGGWRNSYRNGRSRISIERLQSISTAVDAHDRMGSEAFMMVDRSSLYGGSRNLYDQYRDMRLDVDTMSYEELLDLGESIGNVNTGLSEDNISNSLMETIYRPSDQNLEEGSCAICLEEYKNEEEVGTVKNCGHNYHVGCIRKWLLMKNVCPICKTPALKDCLTEE
uniref:RING-type E3 ubiquitin transferase n=2 Tax=Davidia involucrata TaxID=16924 RepID=A0A5B7API0_DAVIN